MPVTAPIANIARGSLHDGPGVRTVIYFKGCGLRCQWCHNPETFTAGKQILFSAVKCIHCGACVETCPEHHAVRGEELVFRREGCIACGKCAENCPSLALSLCGEEKTAEELWAQIRKDLHYYLVSGGGVTFSGGECLLYPQIVAEVAEKCKAEKIHTAVESAFYVPWEHVERVIPSVDLFFADLKIPDSPKHRRFTGRENGLILDNVRRLSKIHPHSIIRIPVIPGVNDSREDMEGLAEIICSLGEGVKEIELLRYNHLAEAKYALSGETYRKFADAPQEKEEMEKHCMLLSEKCGRHCFCI